MSGCFSGGDGGDCSEEEEILLTDSMVGSVVVFVAARGEENEIRIAELWQGTTTNSRIPNPLSLDSGCGRRGLKIAPAQTARPEPPQPQQQQSQRKAATGRLIRGATLSPKPWDRAENASQECPLKCSPGDDNFPRLSEPSPSPLWPSRPVVVPARLLGRPQ